MKAISGVIFVLLNLCLSTSFCQSNYTETINGDSIEMIYVEGGTFQMGNNESKEKDQRPVHTVTVSGFYISKYELTHEQWITITGGKSPINCKKNSPHSPDWATWKETEELLINLNKITSKNYRLPTEAEWEYAARGGAKSKGFKYAGSNTCDSVAWWMYSKPNGGISDKVTYTGSQRVLARPLPVGLKKPNELGIYDMSGNVSEWCSDWYGKYDSTLQINPTGPSSGQLHVVRGGSIGSSLDDCRSFSRYRISKYDTSGIRLVRSL